LANKKFTSINHDYTLYFSRSSSIKEVKDDGQIQKISFQLTPIRTLSTFQPSKVVDVIGVVTEISQRESIKLKDGTQKSKMSL
jgi:replication factor A1